jgi:murein DD-endopeptidase MepM/ murein hydrolase activator NlpD
MKGENVMERRSSSFKVNGPFAGRRVEKGHVMRGTLFVVLVILLSLGAAGCQTDSREYLESDLSYKALQDKVVEENNMMAQAREREHQLAPKTSPSPLWEGRFVRLPNSARMAAFGDHRTYFFDGEEIDQQTHLGIDLASVKAAEVPASNSGKVIYAGEFGIYGQTVVVDHGLGIMSLYGHLRQINVNEGESVQKGQFLGRTGTTGLAGGDHLHLGMYVSGVPVNPIEWWDQHWIDVNVMDRIGM